MSTHELPGGSPRRRLDSSKSRSNSGHHDTLKSGTSSNNINGLSAPAGANNHSGSSTSLPITTFLKGTSPGSSRANSHAHIHESSKVELSDLKCSQDRVEAAIGSLTETVTKVQDELRWLCLNLVGEPNHSILHLGGAVAATRSAAAAAASAGPSFSNISNNFLNFNLSALGLGGTSGTPSEAEHVEAVTTGPSPADSGREADREAASLRVSSGDTSNSNPGLLQKRRSVRVSRTSVASILDNGQGEMTVKRRNSRSFTSNNLSSICSTDRSPSTVADEESQVFVAPTLPMNWPSSIPMRKGSEARGSIQNMEEIGLSMELQGSELENIQMDEETVWTQASRLRDPNSYFNMSLELFGLVMLAYDLTVVPYVLAWDMTLDGILQVMSWISLSFWTVDIFMSFCRGYIVDGEVVFDRRRIASHYMRTWFIPDMSIVSCEYLGVALTRVSLSRNDDESNSMKVLRLVKIGKMLRLLGAFRIVRLVRIMEACLSRTISEQNRMLFRVGALAIGFMWLNHVVSCLWFAVGRANVGGLNWTDRIYFYGNIESDYMETELLYQYATSLHWAMAQTTLGSMEINPTNPSERFFTISCLLLGMLFGSTLVSSLSATMVEVQVRGRDRAQKLTMLRNYLSENNVERHVAMRVFRQVAERLVTKGTITDKDVQVLEILSNSLRQELHAEICRRHLASHPMIHVWLRMDAAWFSRFCWLACGVESVRKADDIFLAGSEASAAYYLMAGSLRYTQEPKSSAVTAVTRQHLPSKFWLCEAALWSEWIHVGTATAEHHCQLMLIRPDKMWAHLRNHLVISALAQDYCQVYHNCIVVARPPEADWPTDLEVPFTDHGDLVYSMDPSAQKRIGLVALQTIGRVKGHLANRSYNKLRTEVVDGKSLVVMNSKGRAERVVALVVLQLQREDGHVFSQIGRYSGDQVSPKCQLPGVKRQQNELTSDAFLRLLETRFDDSLKIQVESADLVIEERESKEYFIQTRYLRKVCKAKLLSPIDAPICDTKIVLAQSSVHEVQSIKSTVAETDELPSHRFKNDLVYVFQTEDDFCLYAWISQADLEHFGTNSGEKELRAWLDSLWIPGAHHLSTSRTSRSSTSRRSQILQAMNEEVYDI